MKVYLAAREHLGRYLTCIANPYFTGGTDNPHAYQNRNRPSPQGYCYPR